MVLIPILYEDVTYLEPPAVTVPLEGGLEGIQNSMQAHIELVLHMKQLNNFVLYKDDFIHNE